MKLLCSDWCLWWMQYYKDESSLPWSVSYYLEGGEELAEDLQSL
jgi:hypothetical protein